MARNPHFGGLRHSLKRRYGIDKVMVKGVNLSLKGIIMRARRFLVVVLLIFSLLAFNTLPPSECTHNRIIVSVGNLDTSQIPQISKEYFSDSPSSAFVTLKSRPQIPSCQGSLFFKFLRQIHPSTCRFPLEAFLPPSTILKLVSTTIMRC